MEFKAVRKFSVIQLLVDSKKSREIPKSLEMKTLKEIFSKNSKLIASKTSANLFISKKS